MIEVVSADGSPEFLQTLCRIIFSQHEFLQDNPGFGISGTDLRKIELRYRILKLAICQYTSIGELLAGERRTPFLKGGKHYG